jgi:competence protein ComFC
MWGKFIDLCWELIDTFVPPRCGGCGQWGERFCDLCLGNVNTIEEPICQICGDPIISSSRSICYRCDSIKRKFDRIRSWAYYEGPLKKAIQKLKYKNDIGLANILANPLTALFKDLDWQIDLITAVPLDQERLSKRGYNQAALLSMPLAWNTGTPFNPEALIKRFPTRPQVGLSEEDRLKNVSDVFSSKPENVEGKNVLVIDDVVTTGATMDACSKALKASGAVTVYGLSLARSLRL